MAVARSTIAFIGRLTLGIGLLGAAALYVDFGAVSAAIAQVDPLMFSVAAAVSALGTIVLPAIATRSTLRAGKIRLSICQLIKINLAMRFYVLTLPHAVTVAIRWHRYNQRQGKGWEIAALLLFERVTQLIAVTSFALVFLLVSYATLPAGLHMLVPLSGGLSALGVLLFLAFVSPRVFHLATPLIHAACNTSPAWLAKRIERLRAAIVDYQKLGSHRISLALCCTFGWYGCLVISGYAVSEGLDTGLGLADIGWMRSTIFLLTLLPITVGGIGVREAGFAFLFELLGVGHAIGLAFGLVLLAIQLLIGLLGLATEAREIAVTLRRAYRAQN